MLHILTNLNMLYIYFTSITFHYNECDIFFGYRSKNKINVQYRGTQF